MDDTYYVASDLGNDTVKININQTDLAIPSVVGQAIKNEKPTFLNQAEQDEYMEHFFEHLEATVISPSVTDLTGQLLVGQAVINNHVVPRRFDINNFSDKSQDDLSLVLNLVILAAKRVQDAYFNHEDLAQLQMQVALTTALPIREGKQVGVTKTYQEKYLQADHLVTFNNFKAPISVKIHFDKVLVSLEGQMAQLALINSQEEYPELAKAVLTDFKEHYSQIDANLEQILAAPNVMGIDIGGKTVDLPVIQNGKANINVSDSSLTGYDSVLQKAIDLLQAKMRNFDSIGQLESYLAAGPSPFDPSSYEQVLRIVKQASSDLVQIIVNNVSKAIGNARLNPDLVFIYGGGAAPLMRDTDLRQRLDQKIKTFNANRSIPLICIKAPYAQELNKLGLELLLKYYVKKAD